MALIFQRDKDDRRSRYEIACDVEEDLARKITRGKRCSFFCGDVECRDQGCMRDKEND